MLSNPGLVSRFLAIVCALGVITTTQAQTPPSRTSALADEGQRLLSEAREARFRSEYKLATLGVQNCAAAIRTAHRGADPVNTCTLAQQSVDACQAFVTGWENRRKEFMRQVRALDPGVGQSFSAHAQGTAKGPAPLRSPEAWNDTVALVERTQIHPCPYQLPDAWRTPQEALNEWHKATQEAQIGNTACGQDLATAQRARQSGKPALALEVGKEVVQRCASSQPGTAQQAQAIVDWATAQLKTTPADKMAATPQAGASASSTSCRRGKRLETWSLPADGSPRVLVESIEIESTASQTGECPPEPPAFQSKPVPGSGPAPAEADASPLAGMLIRRGGGEATAMARERGNPQAGNAATTRVAGQAGGASQTGGAGSASPSSAGQASSGSANEAATNALLSTIPASADRSCARRYDEIWQRAQARASAEGVTFGQGVSGRWEVRWAEMVVKLYEPCRGHPEGARELRQAQDLVQQVKNSCSPAQLQNIGYRSPPPHCTQEYVDEASRRWFQIYQEELSAVLSGAARAGSATAAAGSSGDCEARATAAMAAGQGRLANARGMHETHHITATMLRAALLEAQSCEGLATALVNTLKTQLEVALDGCRKTASQPAVCDRPAY